MWHLKKLVVGYASRYKIWIANLIIIFACTMPYVYIPAYSVGVYLGDGYYLPKALYLYAATILISLLFIVGKLFEIMIHKSPTVITMGTWARKRFIYIFALFLLITLFISTHMSPYQELVYLGEMRRFEGFWSLLCYLVLFLFTAYTFDESRVQELIKLLLISSLPLCIYGFLQFVGLELFPRDIIRENWNKSVFITLGNRNFVGSYATLLLGLSCIKYLSNSSKLYIIPCGAIYSLLIMSMTRGAWLGCIATLVISLLVFRKYLYMIKKKLITMLILFMLLFTVLNVIGNVGGRMLTIGKEVTKVLKPTEDNLNSLGSGRGVIYMESLKLLPDNLIIGSGPDTFAKVFNQQAWQIYRGDKRQIIDKAHSEYLQMWVTLGLPFLIAYLLIVYLRLRGHLLSFKRYNNPTFIMLFISILGYASQATFNISVVSVAPIYWIILGIEPKKLVNNMTRTNATKE